MGTDSINRVRTILHEEGNYEEQCINNWVHCEL